MTQLGEFEGRDVVASQIAIAKAGDGLSAAVEVDPVAMPQGKLVQVLLECRIGPITFDPAKEGDGVVRKHRLITERATIVPDDSPVQASTLGLLNETTERMAQAGVSPGSIPGQGTLEGHDADGDQAVADAIEADDQWEDPEPVRSGAS